MLNAKKLPSNARNETKEPLEAGTYPARLVQVLLLGKLKQRPYKGVDKPPALTLRVTYELVDVFMQDEDGNDIEDRPRWISEEFPFHNLDADLAKSTKRYMALDPKLEYEGDWEKLIGTPVNVTIVLNKGKEDRVYENIGAVNTMRTKEADKLVPLQNDSLVFDFYDPNVDIFLSFPEWLQDKIKEGVDFEGSRLEQLLNDTDSPVEEEKKEEKSDDKEDETDGDW